MRRDGGLGGWLTLVLVVAMMHFGRWIDGTFLPVRDRDLPLPMGAGITA
jgi:hypothetical protein